MELLRETFGDYAIVTLVRTPKYLTGPKVGQSRDPYFVVEARTVWEADNSINNRLPVCPDQLRLLEYRLFKTLAGARRQAAKFRVFYETLGEEVIVWVCMNCGSKFDNPQTDQCPQCVIGDLEVYKRRKVER